VGKIKDRLKDGAKYSRNEHAIAITIDLICALA
jgi:hypothetical protein